MPGACDAGRNKNAMLTDDMQDAAQHMQDAARIVRSINAQLKARTGFYDEIISRMEPDERTAFANLHEAIDALRAQIVDLKTKL